MFKEIFEDILKELGFSQLKRPNYLECPNCQNIMKKLAILFKDNYLPEKVQIDFCEECEGIWFDRGELTKILEMDVKDISKYFPSRSKQSIKGTGRRICPICKSQMTLINYHKNSNIWIDLCPNGCGIFLDAGELELIKLHSIGALGLSSTQTSTQSSTQTSTQTNQSPLTEIQTLSSKVIKLKAKLSEKVKNLETILKNKDLQKMKEFLNKNPFEEELNEIGEIKIQIRNIYSKYGNIREVEEIENMVQHLVKFIDIRTTSISERISNEIKIIESLQTKEQQKEVYLSGKEQKSKPTFDAQTKPILDVQTKPPLDPKTLDKIKEEKTQFETQKVQPAEVPAKPESTPAKPEFTMQKIGLPGYENLTSYIFINNKLFIYSENKIFYHNNDNFQEIKIKELNFRIKKLKVINGKIFLLGSYGNIMILNQDFQFQNTYRIGYLDVIDLIKTDYGFLVISNNRVYKLNEEFKILEEKSSTINFLEPYEISGKAVYLGGTNSLILFDENLNKIKEYTLDSFKTIKKVKKINNVLYLIGSGLVAKFEEEKIIKFDLPKSYLEVNDLEWIKNRYYLACNSGVFYKTEDLKVFEEIKLNIFDNIFCIISYENKIYLACSNSSVIVLGF